MRKDINIKISIIVPNYNHAKYLNKRLESIFNQTYQNFEVIFLDDYSTDNSVEILSKYAKHEKVSHFVKNEKNSGIPFKQWNKGLKLAKGEYIWIAESDDYADSSLLENLLLILENKKNVGFAISQTRKINSTSEIIGNYDNWEKHYIFNNDNILEINGHQFLINNMLRGNNIPNVSAMLFRKELIDKVGFADESMKFSSDWLLWIKFLSISDIGIYSKYLNYRRAHPQVTSDMEVYYEEYFRVLFYISTINKKVLMNKIDKIFLNDRIRDTYYNLISIKSIGWKNKVLKSIIILYLNLHFANLLLFIGNLINYQNLEKDIYNKIINRVKTT